jgi:hypothetical protein
MEKADTNADMDSDSQNDNERVIISESGEEMVITLLCTVRVQI